MELLNNWEKNNYGRRILNMESFIVQAGVFNISAIEKKAKLPVTTLQKHIKRTRPFPSSGMFRLEKVLEEFGYLKDKKYYSDMDVALAPMKFLNL